MKTRFAAALSVCVMLIAGCSAPPPVPVQYMASMGTKPVPLVLPCPDLTGVPQSKWPALPKGYRAYYIVKRGSGYEMLCYLTARWMDPKQYKVLGGRVDNSHYKDHRDD